MSTDHLIEVKIPNRKKGKVVSTKASKKAPAGKKAKKPIGRKGKMLPETVVDVVVHTKDVTHSPLNVVTPRTIMVNRDLYMIMIPEQIKLYSCCFLQRPLSSLK